MKKILTALAILAVIAAGTVTAVFQQRKAEDYACADDAIRAHLPEGYEASHTFCIGEDSIAVLNNREQGCYGFMEIYRKNDSYVLHSLNLQYKSAGAMTATFSKKKEWSVKIHLTPLEDGSMEVSMEVLPLPQKAKK